MSIESDIEAIRKNAKKETKKIKKEEIKKNNQSIAELSKNLETLTALENASDEELVKYKNILNERWNIILSNQNKRKKYVSNSVSKVVFGKDVNGDEMFSKIIVFTSMIWIAFGASACFYGNELGPVFLGLGAVAETLFAEWSMRLPSGFYDNIKTIFEKKDIEKLSVLIKDIDYVLKLKQNKVVLSEAIKKEIEDKKRKLPRRYFQLKKWSKKTTETLTQNENHQESPKTEEMGKV